MGTTVIAAIIAAASTGVVGITGFVINAVTTRRTMRSSREAAQDERVWAKRSAVYEELTRHVNELKDNSQYGLESAFAARVVTYASHDVLMAYHAAATAALQADVTKVLHGAQAETINNSIDLTNPVAARMKQSHAAADKLIDLIRDELGSQPVQRKRWAWSRWPWSSSWISDQRG